MRPTDLQLRPPDEITTELYYPVVTHVGHRLEFPLARPSKSVRSTPTFSRAKRFPLTKAQMNELVGPGSYDLERVSTSFSAKTSMARYVKPNYFSRSGEDPLILIGNLVKGLRNSRSAKNFNTAKRCYKCEMHKSTERMKIRGCFSTHQLRTPKIKEIKAESYSTSYKLPIRTSKANEMMRAYNRRSSHKIYKIANKPEEKKPINAMSKYCLLYTSDAADE
eukprot:TRINITY_DN4775_c0_g1_i35.p1 TRINITY_DN4775_c0_g1~~TRINITY_DN4775_c0_g1_i35.p1  ORF type:complete len:221 (-),score=25.94 TRINITY_DN4775_c0_g1_i35:55-717(-)